MRCRTVVVCSCLILAAAGCQSEVSGPELAAENPAAIGSVAFIQHTGPSNRCYGDIVQGIASTWPWAHDDKIDFAPPPGAVELWVQTFGPGLGVSSVRELQQLFC